ncbi:hypothetical protein [Rhodococcus sp. NPDC058521]|uniref:hypothetical protein n=1 Tax=Rhodococcus sp. NPDC058521 TaxID=3346536 RepID=UPI00365610B9
MTSVYFSRKAVRRHRMAAISFVVLTFVGELSTVVALMLTWVALWSPAAWDRIDDLLVFVPGTLSILCAVLLTVESVGSRIVHILRAERKDALVAVRKRTGEANGHPGTSQPSDGA